MSTGAKLGTETKSFFFHNLRKDHCKRAKKHGGQTWHGGQTIKFKKTLKIKDWRAIWPASMELF